MRILILGGTTEATTLARHLEGRHDVSPVLSLAGRTRKPVTPPIPFRIGGFGGVDGLRTYLQAQRINAVIDATHPFAAGMSANAAAACHALRLPVAGFTRSPWQAQDGDRWTRVDSVPAAVDALGTVARRVFLTIGGVQLAAFARAPHHHYIIRTIDPPEAIAALPSHKLVLARGPFRLDDEIALLQHERIDILVTKNSGGAATQAKITAARMLGLPVIMIERPPASDIRQFVAVQDVLAWIDHHRPPP
jgi:precorrin-6A/cobalt-precorrin-6A reductase